MHGGIAAVGIALATIVLLSSGAFGIGETVDEAHEHIKLTPEEVKAAREVLETHPDWCSRLFDPKTVDATIDELNLPTTVDITSARQGFRCIADNERKTVAVAFFAEDGSEPAAIVSNDRGLTREMKAELLSRGFDSVAPPDLDSRSALRSASSAQLKDVLAEAVNR